MSVSFTNDRIIIESPTRVEILYVDTYQAESITQARNSISQIVLNPAENITVGTFYNPDNNYYSSRVNRNDVSLRQEISSLLKELSVKAQEKVGTLIYANVLDKDEVNGLIATVSLVSSVLGKVYVCLTVNQVASDIDLKDDDKIDTEIEKIKGLLKDSFSHVLKLDSIDGM